MKLAFIAIIFALLSQVVNAQQIVTAGKVSVTEKQLQPGQAIELTGEWLYKPGYLNRNPRD